MVKKNILSIFLSIYVSTYCGDKSSDNKHFVDTSEAKSIGSANSAHTQKPGQEISHTPHLPFCVARCAKPIDYSCLTEKEIERARVKELSCIMLSCGLDFVRAFVSFKK